MAGRSRSRDVHARVLSAGLIALAVVGCGGSTGSASPVAPSSRPSSPAVSASANASLQIREFAVPAGSHPHDVAPAADGGVWFTAQSAGKLGHLDPSSGKVREIALGAGSAPHGVITGPDGAA